ncbi:galactose-specific lectin nattectin-like [Hippoglossus hippoglossus]|uniref:galactose-specific lectin nattectin-like n=1 Tax=Hippoglossus hippoglossus TaxID=8267 RepID=UPI00148E42F2|nr:galactose-specific lectin nattectin-like [Hippoglossus hippoglossus]
MSCRSTATMSLIKSKGALGIRGRVLLSVFMGLLVCGAVSQAADAPEEELAELKQRFDSLKNRYKLLCEKYSNLATNCSAPVLTCTECPDGWFQVADQCFQISTDRQDWLTSKSICELHGSNLAILTTMKQHDGVDIESRRIEGFYTHYWIGLTDADKEGEWKWFDNSTLNNPFWDNLKPEPDNHLSGGPEGEDCAVVNSRSQKWYDVPCSFKYPRICQMAAKPLH